MNTPTSQTTSVDLDYLFSILREGIDRGKLHPARDLIEQYPAIAQRTDIAVQLVYEEYCQRRESGEPIDPEELLQQYPQWHSKLAIVLECDGLLNQNDADLKYPTAGESIAGFTLQQQIGNGVAGVVYLASQPALSNRPVVIKLSPCTGEEHLSLARLQHSAIVPLLYCEDDEERGIRVLAMPYVGGCTLAQAIETMADKPIEERCGMDFVNAIHGYSRQTSPVGESNPSTELPPAIRFLQSASYQQAVCWIMAQLADGLHYAHLQGYVHLDLKPSNVLLSSDGQPMLLDFHLAQQRAQLHGKELVSLGGTPGYMAPEQQQAIQQLSLGQPTTRQIDHRCDIYALGLLIDDLLLGTMPSPHIDGWEYSRPTPDGREKDIYTNEPLNTLIQRCLAPLPSDRPDNTAAIAGELRQIALPPKVAASRTGFLRGFLSGTIAASAIFYAAFCFPSATSQPSALGVQASAEWIDQLHLVAQSARLQEEDHLALDPTQQVRMIEICNNILSNRSNLMLAMEQPRFQKQRAQVTSDLEQLSRFQTQLLNALP